MSIITTPFALLLRYLSQWFNSYGVALILFALIVTLIRIPFDAKSKRSTMKTSLLQPKIQALQEKYASNQQKMNAELQKLYKEENVKVMGGCVWMMVPMIIIILLISIVREPLTHLMRLDATQLEALRSAIESMGYTLLDAGSPYSQVEIASYIRPHFTELQAVVPEIFNLNMEFLTLNLGDIPNWRFFMEDAWTAQDVGLFLLPVLSVILSYISQKVLMNTNYMPQAAEQQGSMKMFMLMMPLMSLWFGFSFPASMSIYFISSSIFTTISSAIVNRHFGKIFAEMKAEMEEKDKRKAAELEAKRQETERLRALGATKENKATSKRKKGVQEREKERQRLAAQRPSDKDEAVNPSREGHRKYARGRGYDPDRFSEGDPAEEAPDETPADTPVPDSTEDPMWEDDRLVDDDDDPEDDDPDAFDDDPEDDAPSVR